MDFWISRVFLDFTISDLFLSSISHYRPIRADLSNEASVIACLRRLNLSSHQNYVAQTLAGRSQPSHYCCSTAVSRRQLSFPKWEVGNGNGNTCTTTVVDVGQLLPCPQAIFAAKEAGTLHLDRSDPVKVSCALKIVEHGFRLRN